MEPPRTSSPTSVSPSPPVTQRVRGRRRETAPTHKCLTCGDVFRSLPYLRVHQSLNHCPTRAMAWRPLERPSYEQRALARSAAMHRLSHILDYFYQQRIHNRGRGRRPSQETENNCLNPSGSAPRYALQTNAPTMAWAEVTRTSTMPAPFLEGGQAAATPNYCMVPAPIHFVPAPYHPNSQARPPNYPNPIQERLPRGLFPLNATNFGTRNWVPQHIPDHVVVNSATRHRANLVIGNAVSAPMLVGGRCDAGYMDALFRSLARFQPAEANRVLDGAEEDNPQGLDLNLHL